MDPNRLRIRPIVLRGSRRWIVALAALSLVGVARPAVAAPPAQSPEVARSIALATQYLKQHAPGQKGREGLYVYALLKGGVPPQDPVVQGLLQGILAKFDSGRYRYIQYHWYEAACDLMALEAVDPERYRKEIENIALVLAAAQNDAGGWNYPEERNTGGDTSVTQYAILGLWAAQRAGVEVPLATWDKAAAWLTSAPQLPNGAFMYSPRHDPSPKHSMTVAGVGSLYVCRQYLYPDAPAELALTPAAQPQPQQPKPETLEERQKRLGIRWGVLEPIPLEPEEEKPPEVKPAAGPGRPRMPLTRIDQSIRGGMQWLGQNFTIVNPSGWPKYYLYGLERMAALANVQHVGTHDWFAEGSAYLLRTQSLNGSWDSTEGEESGPIGACFCVLFLSRATGQLVGSPPPEPIAGGLLKGGRLPEDLSTAQLNDGNVQQHKLSGPFEELLAELAKGEAQMAAAQQAIVEKVQLGDREGLVGQKDRLIELARHSDPEIRRTAIWALGRTDDLELVPLLLKSLEDPDVDVMVEAGNALCFIARKPDGFGLAAGPFQGLVEPATDLQRKQSLDRWRELALDRWARWHFSTRPYAERDDLREKARTR
ncbi:MAG: HEAT repeat domain-containing protein [Planctomycetales bacterium]